MKQKTSRRPTGPQPPGRAPGPAAQKKALRPHLALGLKNYLTMAAGLVAITIGFITLAGGSITLAPLLLVLGYCVIIPVGLLLR
ncbi:MAG: hypothetical protein R6X14_02675 [bacterium]